jgi:L-fuculose-phosphate aldolase
MTYEALRANCVAIARRAALDGLVRGTSGNLSVRTPSGALITATGTSLGALREDELVGVELGDAMPRETDVMPRETNPGGGSASPSKLRPSSEWPFHRDIYAARADVSAVFHAHAPAATALACLGRPLPPFHYMVAISGRAQIEIAPYATFGTDVLSRGVVCALAEGFACLLAHHGLVTCGRDLQHAYDVALEVEGLCDVYLRACAVAEPPRLSLTEMTRVIEKFRHYGRRSSNGE